MGINKTQSVPVSLPDAIPGWNLRRSMKEGRLNWKGNKEAGVVYICVKNFSEGDRRGEERGRSRGERERD